MRARVRHIETRADETMTLLGIDDGMAEEADEVVCHDNKPKNSLTTDFGKKPKRIFVFFPIFSYFC